MLHSHLTIILRNLLKHKGFATINICGLAVGMAASFLILQYVTNELSYDDFHGRKQDVYRVEYDFYSDGVNVFKSATAFPRVGPEMKKDFPEVEEFARLFLRYGGGVVRYKDLVFKEDLLFQADQSFLDLFSYELVNGDRETALLEPGTALISTDLVEKYFGGREPVGERIQFGSDEEYTITGVIRSPENSHLKFTFLFSYPTLVQKYGDQFETAWGWYDFYTYVRLTPGADPMALEAKLPDFVARNSDDENAGERTRFVLQAMPDIHLHSNLIQEARVNGDGDAVSYLTLIAFFILVIAWINYINLSTARAVERAREIGIRKAVGANQIQLIRQFIFESVAVNLIAMVLAGVMVVLFMPVFSAMVGQNLIASAGFTTSFWLLLLAFFLVGALLSGLYPAFVLSSYRPSVVLKGMTGLSHKGLNLRKVLVVGQFAASIGLIAGTLVVYNQISFMRNQSLGINIAQTLVVDGPGVIENDSLFATNSSAFKAQALTLPNVNSVTASTEIPGNLIFWTNGGVRVSADDDEERTIMYRVGIDYDFFDAYGHELIAGRGFSRDFTADERSVVLNEMAVDVLGFASVEAAVNDRVRIGGDTLTVVGVVANYHQEGLQADFRQTAFSLIPDASSYYAFKLSGSDVPGTIAAVEAVFKDFFPGNPFSYKFLDDFFNAQYITFRRFGYVFGFFSLLAIFVACLGLFGLASFTAVQRTKEIGIRKVLGSSVSEILILLSKDFMRFVLISGIIAIPVVWYAMSRWLQDFAFHIELGWPVFAFALVITAVIALMTVSWQSLRVAASNPVESLRSE